MNKITYIILGVVVVIIVAASVISLNRNNNSNQDVQAQNSNIGTGSNQNSDINTGQDQVVVYSDSGYAPAELRVKRGTAVTYQNSGSLMMWTASAFHPSHEVYPGTSVSKCGSDEATTMFDACQGIGPGGSWMFTFDQAGAWKYHNHLNPSHFGAIIVE